MAGDKAESSVFGMFRGGARAKWATRSARRLDADDDREVAKAYAWLPALARDALDAGPGYAGDEPVSPGKARLVGVIVLGCFGLIWNGIIAVFIVGMFTQGAPWPMRLFMVPFVLVGVGVLLGEVYMVLGLANPRLRMVFRPRVAVPGQRVKLEWTIDGRAERIARLTLTVEAEEQATYRRGTDTTTDKHIIWNKVVYEHGTALEGSYVGATVGPPRVSEVEFDLPNNAMHSLEGGNNKVVWRVKVAGEIPRWPNVNDEYAFAVVPSNLADRLPEEARRGMF